MTNELIKQAREAGFQVSDTFGVQAGAHPIGEKLERFAALRDEAMKKRCAEAVTKVLRDIEKALFLQDDGYYRCAAKGGIAAANECIAAIMALDVDHVNTSPECVDETAKSIHVEPTNSCQKPTELVEKRGHAGSFGSD